MSGKMRGWRYTLLVLGLAAVAWMVMDFNGRMAELHHLTSERDFVQFHYAEVKGTLAALEAEVAFARSDSAVEQWAYEEGRMLRAGDYGVVPIAAAGSTPTPAPRPAVVQPELSNRESWLALLLGANTP